MARCTVGGLWAVRLVLSVRVPLVSFGRGMTCMDWMGLDVVRVKGFGLELEV